TAPAFQATRWKVAGTLKEEAATSSSAAGQVRLRKSLVAAQIALSLLLLIGAGLFARSLYNLRTLRPGVDTERLLTFSIDPTLAGYSPQRALSLYEELQSRLSRVPGATAVTIASTPVLANDISMATVRIEGYQAKEGEDMNPDVNGVGPDFAGTLGLHIVQGRDFTSHDRVGAPKVAVINETMARRYFGDQSPLGRHIGFGGRRKPIDIQIVGVVRDSKVRNLRDVPPRVVYIPFLQDDNPASASFYVRTALDPAQLAAAIRRDIAMIDANLPIAGMRTMERQLDALLFIERLVALLSVLFGLLATALAAVGLYGVMAFTVARRTREIGIRMALGAERRRVIGMVMGEVALLAAAGVVIGLPGSLAVGQYVRAQLFGIQPNDPATIAAATATLVVIALFAGFLPAWRVTRVDPAIALRYE
ncbi:MAG TPA: FtsX-like permease family protein, partial [Bryobacteraceae bacterium]|nr:FtsX-like permease family protein [Bryobacteraceae bacterium]